MVITTFLGYTITSLLKYFEELQKTAKKIYKGLTKDLQLFLRMNTQQNSFVCK